MSKLSHKQVLFVDDDPYLSQNFARYLKNHGILEIDAARSVTVAVSLLDVTKYEVIVLDLMMPHGPLETTSTSQGFHTGIELAKKARSNSENSNAKIYIYTTSRDLDEKYVARNNIIDGIFHKGEESRLLQQLMRDLQLQLPDGIRAKRRLSIAKEMLYLVSAIVGIAGFILALYLWI